MYSSIFQKTFFYAIIRISCVSPMNNAKRRLFKFCPFAEPFDINNITNKIKKKYGNSSSIENTCKKPFRR